MRIAVTVSLMIGSIALLTCAVLGADSAASTETPATPATKPGAAIVTPPAKPKFQLYLLMGQSNMEGRDTTGLNKQVENPRILALNSEGQWVVAKEPLFSRSGGIGPGISFASEMLKTDKDITIGLVPCAVGGSALGRWIKGGDLYAQAVARAKVAATVGTLKGVLWHQGESDTGKKNLADSYEKRVTKMFADLRADLGQPKLPIVVGQLGEFLSVGRYAYVDTVRQAIQRIPADVPSTAYVDSTGLHDRGDKLHFNAASQVEFGVRYAEAMRDLQASEK